MAEAASVTTFVMENRLPWPDEGAVREMNGPYDTGLIHEGGMRWRACRRAWLLRLTNESGPPRWRTIFAVNQPDFMCGTLHPVPDVVHMPCHGLSRPARNFHGLVADERATTPPRTRIQEIHQGGAKTHAGEHAEILSCFHCSLLLPQSLQARRSPKKACIPQARNHALSAAPAPPGGCLRHLTYDPSSVVMPLFPVTNPQRGT